MTADAWDASTVDAEFDAITAALDADTTDRRHVFIRTDDVVSVELPAWIRELLTALFAGLGAHIQHGDAATLPPQTDGTDQGAVFAFGVDEMRLDALNVDMYAGAVTVEQAWTLLQALNDVRMWVAPAAGAEIGPHHECTSLTIPQQTAAEICGLVGALIDELVDALM
jgi:hypothetical protein